VSVIDAGSVPPGWSVVSFGRVARRVKEVGRPDLPPLSVFLGSGVVPRDSRADNHNQLGEDLSKYLVVRCGDLVFNKLRTWQGGLGSSAYEGIVSPAYFVCRPSSGYETRFLQYLLLSDLYLQELTRVSKWQPPSQFDIGWEQLRVVPIVSPSVPAQQAIADFLDGETERIDALIATKERLAACALERLEARISQLVSGETGDSLETENSHWRPTQLREFLVRRRRSGYPDLPLLSVSRAAGVTVRSESSHWLPAPSEDLSGYQLVDIDNLVMNQLGKPHGSIGVSKDRGIISPAYFVAEIGPSANPRFVHYLLRTRRLVCEYERRGKLMPPSQFDISWEAFRSIPVLLPPIEVQERVAELIDGWEIAHRSFQILLAAQLNLLKERRQAIITAAVTGELDIPGVAA
jgi:type I restriction enzyme S subunit